MKLVVVLLLAASLSGCSTSAPGRTEAATIESIVATPTKGSYEALRSTFHGDRNSCTHIDAMSSDASGALVEMIQAGDEVALRSGLLVFRCWDGGLLGDFFRATGQYFDQEPTAFLANLGDYLLWRSDVRSLVATLPESDVDDLGAQITTMRRRQAALAMRSDLSWLAEELGNKALRLENLRRESGL